VSRDKNQAPGPGTSCSQEFTEEFIRERAYELFEARGCESGHELDDWLQAEAEVRGKKSVAGADETPGEPEVVAA
jgi:hypothetical protein